MMAGKVQKAVEDIDSSQIIEVVENAQAKKMMEGMTGE
jgi:hypothetical protein